MNKTGLENAPKIMQNFVETLNKNRKKPIKPSWLNKYRSLIIKLAEEPYKIIKWFIFASILVVLVVEKGGFNYVA